MITHTQAHILSSIAAAAGCYMSSTVAFDYGAAVKQSHKERSDWIERLSFNCRIKL